MFDAVMDIYVYCYNTTSLADVVFYFCLCLFDTLAETPSLVQQLYANTMDYSVADEAMKFSNARLLPLPKITQIRSSSSSI